MWGFTLAVHFILSLLSGDKIPFHQINGLIYLNVTIDGENQQFLLDTGCSAILVNGPVEHSDVVLESIYGELPSSTISLKNVQVGRETATNVDGLRADLSKLRKGKEKIDGILGMSFTDDHILAINYEYGLFSFLNSASKAEMTNTRNTFSFPIINGANNSPLVVLESEGNRLLFLLDTGANVHAVKDKYADLVGDYLRLKNNKKMVTIPTRALPNELPSIYNIKSSRGIDNSLYHGILSVYQLGFDEVILDFRNNELILIK